MARGRGLAGILAALAVSASLFACVDLFHSTSDFLDECALDATVPACGADARLDAVDASEARAEAEAQAEAATAPDAAIDLCAAAPEQAARRACAWLGACASPLGVNAFGPCMVQALLAFDCRANPNHPARGAARDRWACLAAASADAGGCAPIRKCVFPVAEPSCADAGVGMSCANGTDPAQQSVRAECVDDAAPPGGENCALQGKACVVAGGAAICGSTGGLLACSADTPAGCEPAPTARLHWCGPDGTDIGIDCTSNGAQQCAAFPPGDASSWVACIPTRVGDASCPAAIDTVTCSGGIATSCPAGVPETIDCAALLGSPDGCSTAPLSPAFDWTSPCQMPDAGPTADQCDGSTLTSWTRGTAFSLDCHDAGLGLCRLVPTALGAEIHAACTPP